MVKTKRPNVVKTIWNRLLAKTQFGYRFYFFGFFESATGEETPIFLQPMITFPAIFLGVALSYFALVQGGTIFIRGDGGVIPGIKPFNL